MSFLKKRDTRIFELSSPHASASFALSDSVLTIQLVDQQSSRVFSKTYTPQAYTQDCSLMSYFDSPASLFHFVSKVSDQFVSSDSHGNIKIVFLAQELQERTLEIALQGRSEVQLQQRIHSLEDSFAALARHTYHSKMQSDRQLEFLRADFERMRAAYEESVSVLEKKVEDYSQFFKQVFKGQVYAHKRHNRLTIGQNRICNERQEGNEVRWAILGPQVSSDRNTVVRLKVNRMEWFAFGFCLEKTIQSRKYSRLNGCGPHGGYVMDNSGWVYAQAHQDNYRQLGFSFGEGETLSLIYSPRQHLISFISHSTWRSYELVLAGSAGLSPCIACNREAEIEILDYSM